MTSPSLIATLILHGYILSASSSVHLLLHIGPVLDVLVESANVAGDIVIRFEGEGD